MNNYLAAEIYRYRNKKGKYKVFIITFLIMLTAVLLTKLVSVNEPGFKYDTKSFMLGMVFEFALGINLIGHFISSFFTEKTETPSIKNTINYGISKRTIYLTKLLNSFAVFTITSILLLLSLIAMVQILPDTMNLKNYIVAIVNISPVILFTFTISHYFNLRNKPLLSVVFIIFIIKMFHGVYFLTFSKVEMMMNLSKHLPGNIIGINNYMLIERAEISFNAVDFALYIGLSIVSVLIGMALYEREDM